MQRILGLIITAALALSFLSFRYVPDSASIGIIGGADGPTAIFITGASD